MTVHFLNILNLTGLRSVFTTLVHSLWLGAVTALLAGIIITLTNKSTSLLRYKLLTALLTLFVGCIMYIFYDALNTNTETFTTGKVIVVPGQGEIKQTQNVQKGVFNTLLSFTETHADTIVSIWFIVICFKCIGLISGLRALHRLKKTNILEAGTYWMERMNELAVQIGIVKQVTLLQTSLAKIPMVIGHLKPVILFPIGILNALPANEVEAILLHELAHIKRNDFLINLLQQFAEIIFFFNPGVLWVSSLIKNERENCCDDIAIAVTHDKRKFIHALVAFQEYNAGLEYATTFPGQKNHLLNRVKRIITNNNKTLNNMEKLILASGIIITTMAALAFSPNHTKSKKETVRTVQTITKGSSVDNATIKETKSKSNTNAAQKITADTTSKIHYSGVIDGKKIRLTEENGQVKELYVDGKKIPEDQYDKYTIIIEKVHQNMKENTAKLKMESDLLKSEKEEMEQGQMQAMKETEEMIETIEMKEANEMRETEEMEEAKEMKEANEMKEAEEMKEQDNLMKQDLHKQQEQIKQKQVEMQKEMKLMNKKNQEVMKKNQQMMKVQSVKMQADLIKQQKQFQLKQVEFQKKAQKMKLQQEKFNKLMRDSTRAKRITRVKPAVYSRPVISVKPVAVAKSEVSVKPTVSVQSVTSVRPAIVTSTNAISSVNAEPAPSVTPVLAVTPTVYVTSGSISNEIISDLEKANIIDTRNNLSFRLTNNELIVNGVKQTDAIHQSILKKYVKKPGDNISLSYSNQQ